MGKSIKCIVKGNTIEMSDVRIYDELSEETLCFVGEISLNGISCGGVRNDGRGGATMLNTAQIESIAPTFIEDVESKSYWENGKEEVYGMYGFEVFLNHLAILADEGFEEYDFDVDFC